MVFGIRRKELDDLRSNYDRLKALLDYLPAVVLNDCYGSLNAREVDGKNRNLRFSEKFSKEAAHYIDAADIVELEEAYEKVISIDR